MIRAIEKLIAPLKRRIYLMCRRFFLDAINDDAQIQALKIKLMSGETRDQVERFQNYGLTSHPHPGAEGVVVFVGGNTDHGLIVAVDDRRFRLQPLAQGEVALYDDIDQRVHLKRNGINIESPENIQIKTDGILRLEADGVEIHGRDYVQTDVAGKGSRETFTSGNDWHTDSYTNGADTTSTEHGIDQPHIPSDHPDGPQA